jgi:hypothetical protein
MFPVEYCTGQYSIIHLNFFLVSQNLRLFCASAHVIILLFWCILKKLVVIGAAAAKSLCDIKLLLHDCDNSDCGEL